MSLDGLRRAGGSERLKLKVLVGGISTQGVAFTSYDFINKNLAAAMRHHHLHAGLDGQWKMLYNGWVLAACGHFSLRSVSLSNQHCLAK